MKYDVILADSPWGFEVWNKDTGARRSASAHYDTMSVEDICKLPIADLAEKNCALFFWGVWPRLFDCQAVINAWGFSYRTLAWVWVKQTKDQMKFATGMGYYTRANSEFCLLAIKGKMPVQAHDVLAVIASPRQAHSQKPDEQYCKIERLYPNMKYLELFARRPRDGWDAFGNEIENSIVLESS